MLRAQCEVLRAPRDKATGKEVEPDVDAVVETVSRCFRDWERYTGHYFHTLYRVLKYVDDHGEIDRRSSAKTLRSQLPTPEVVLMSHYGLTGNGAKLKALIEKYGMLEDIEDRHFCDARLKRRYAQSAFNAG